MSRNEVGISSYKHYLPFCGDDTQYQLEQLEQPHCSAENCISSASIRTADQATGYVPDAVAVTELSQKQQSCVRRCRCVKMMKSRGQKV